MTTKNVTALIINDFDSTCAEAAISAGHFFTNSCNQEFAAIPSCYSHAVRVTSVARKHFNYVCLEFPDGTKKRISSFIDSSAEAAIEEARNGFAEDGKDINDIECWEDVD